MKIFLDLRPWQVFVLLWGIPVLTVFIPFESLLQPAIFISFTSWFSLILFGWLISIGKFLPSMLPSGIHISTNSFTFHCRYIAAVFALTIILVMFRPNNVDSLSFVLLFIALYYFVAVFIVLRFLSRTLATIEKGELAKPSDYVGYFFLFWINPVGIWIIQPKLNRLIANKSVAA